MLEQVIAENTAAVNNLAALIGKVQLGGIPIPVPAAKPADVQPKTTQPASTPAQPPAAAATGDISYEKQLKPLILKSVKEKGRDAVAAICAKYPNKDNAELPATNGLELRPADYKAVFDELNVLYTA